MHLQNTVHDWLDAVPHLPKGGIVRALGSPSWLAQVKALRPDVYTSYRYYIGDGQTAEGTWEECKEHWRRIYRRWVDKTYLEQYAPYVDMVAEANEYAATTTWQSANDTNRVMQSLAAAVVVWNNEYRGRWVSSADGGHGLIPATTRLCLLAQPVSNDVPAAVMRLALDTDNVIDYRAYAKCVSGQRVPECWREHSGRWHFMEQSAGLKPLWMFGECGPYFHTIEGWRHPACLGGDENKLYAVMRAFFRDVAGTPAFREGRLLGSHGCWYSTGDPGGTWKEYELDAGQLVRLAQIAREELTPQEAPVTDEEKAKVAFHAKEILKIVDPSALAPAWWQKPAPYVFKAQPANPLKLYRPDRVTVGASLNYSGWEISVAAVDPAGWLKVVDPPGDASDLWLRAADVTPA